MTGFDGPLFRARVTYPNGQTAIRVLFRRPHLRDPVDEGLVVEYVASVDETDDRGLRIDFEITTVQAPAV